jgi:hypothetical protein
MILFRRPGISQGDPSAPTTELWPQKKGVAPPQDPSGQQGMTCGHCQKLISRHSITCHFCGARFCQACRAANDSDARYCGNCGQII